MKEKMEFVIPSRARNIKQLLPAKDINHDNTSTNEIFLMKKRGKIDSQTTDKLLFFKKNSPHSRLAELEAYCGSLCQLLAGADYVPTTRAYYNDLNEMVGVTSKAINGFHSNFEIPLQTEDTLINSVPIKIEQCQRSIERMADTLINLYDEEIGASQRSSPYAFVEDSYHAWFDKEATAHYARACILAFLNNKKRYSEESLQTISSELQKRIEQLADNFENNPEHNLLVQMKQAIRALRTLYHIEDPEEISIELFEKLDQAIKNDGDNIDDLYKSAITKEIDGFFYTIDVSDIRNYRILKGQAICLSTRFIFKEGDANNSNMSKNGQFFDFNWTKANILFHFKNNNFLDGLFRHPEKNSFACTEHNLKHFPDVDAPTLFYWPTKQPDVHKPIFDHMSRYLRELEISINNTDSAPIKKMLGSALRIHEIITTLNQEPVSKTLTQSTTDVFYWGMIQIKALAQRRSAQELIDEEQIKYFFNLMHQHISGLENEISKLASNIDKKDLKTLVSLFEDELNENVYDKITELREVLSCFCQEMHDMFLSLAKRQSMIRHKYNFFNENDVNSVFTELDTIFEQIHSQLNDMKEELKLHCDSFERNSFSLKDNNVFKSLAVHPVFIFHKYKTFLKYVLTNEQIYHTLAHLNIGFHASTTDCEWQYNIHEALVKDEMARIDEIRNTLITMPDFRQFLEEHGEYVLELLKDEFDTLRIKYQAKTATRPLYHQLVKALNIDLIEEKFNDLCRECDLDYMTSSVL